MDSQKEISASELIPHVYKRGSERGTSLALGYYKLKDNTWLLLNRNSSGGVIYTEEGESLGFVNDALTELAHLKPQHVPF